MESSLAYQWYLWTCKEFMVIDNQRVVLWCGGAPNQKALANKIATEFNVAGIVIDERPGSVARRSFSIPAIAWDRFRFRSIYGAWKSMMKYYADKYPSWPGVPTLRVTGINNREAEEFTKALSPAIIAVSGTALVKKPMLDVPASIGIINLHTGLSPYVKGGPNCTNWCIANNSFHLVGNTIMWLNAGIDSGNIITTETIDIRNSNNLRDAHIRVMEHAHDLYIRAIRYLLKANKPYISVPQQDLGKGELFLNRMWTAEKRRALLINWKKRKLSEEGETPITISLPM